MAVRTTIQLDEALAARLRSIVPPRRLNRFINQTLAEKVDAVERERLEAEMKEGYLAQRAERAEMNDEWGVVDGEGWPS